MEYFLRLGNQLRLILHQRENGDFYRSKFFIKLEHHSCFTILERLFRIGFRQKSEQHPPDTDRRFNDMRHIFLIRRLIEILKRDTGELGMLSQVIIPARVDALELLEPERKLVLDVIGFLGIKHQILVFMPTEIFFFHSKIQIKLPAIRP